jgi:hypothetical protein
MMSRELNLEEVYNIIDNTLNECDSKIREQEFVAEFPKEKCVGTVKIGDVVFNAYCSNIKAYRVGGKIRHTISLIEY